MRYSWTVEEFLAHSDRCDGNADLLQMDWDECTDLPARVHLLNLWLGEDSPGAPAILTELRDVPRDDELRPETVIRNGLFRIHDTHSGMRREPRDWRPIDVSDALAVLERSLFGGGTLSPRAVQILGQVGIAVLEQGEGAALVTMVDPDTGAVMDDETHLMVLGVAPHTVTRISLVPRLESRAEIDPACTFAGCPQGARITPEERGLAETRLRAICAGTVLSALLDCDGRAAFKVDWQPHGIEPGQHADLATVRAWWETTPWHADYSDDYIDLYYDYGAGNWQGSHTHLLDLADDIDNDAPYSPPILGDSAKPPDHFWMIGEGMSPLDTDTFQAELERLRRAYGAGPTLESMVDHLFHELLTRPLERVGGPERQMAVWADADGGGSFWQSDHRVDTYDDARRLLVVGPTEALYIVFRGEMGA